MNDFKEIVRGKRKSDLWFSAGVGALAALTYGLTLSRGVFPGESASLMTAYSGIEPLELPLRPFWGTLVAWLSRLDFLSLPLRLNLFSAVCTVVSAVLLYRLVSFLIHDCIYEEYAVEHAERVAALAGAVASVAFIFAVPVWQAATRFQYQSFELMLVFVAASLLTAYARRRWAIFLLMFAALYGAGVAESVIFIPLAPVFLSFLIYVLLKRGTLSLARVAWMGALAAAVMVGVYWYSAKWFMSAHDVEAMGFKSVSDILTAVGKNQLMQLRSGLPQFNWLILLLMSVVPWVAGGFASFRALNNERSWSQYILHFTLSVLVVLGLTNTAVSPWGIMRPAGRLPVCSYAMIAMTAGYLFAYWYLLLKVNRPKRGNELAVMTKLIGDWLGLILTYPLAAVVVLAAVINAFECRGGRGDFADRCAREILDRMSSRTWFVTDGTLDAHLRIMAKMRGQELNLLCLQNDMNPFYLKTVAKLIEEKRLFGPENMQRMKSTLDLGVLPFLQDWFAMDREIEKKVAVFGVPDFWYTAGITPVSEYLFFTGSRNIDEYKGKPLFQDHMDFWKRMDSVLAPNRKGSDDPTLRHRAHLRRHMGFVANNLGVLLEDLGEDEAAYNVYTYVRNVVDPDNISALFNRFEMARRGAKAASASKEAIERELKDFIGNLKHKYPLWSLSRYYGYVRSPEMFAKLGWGWALSGQTGAALAGVRRAINLLPTDQQTGAMQAMAAIYALADDRVKTAAVYQDIIKSDPNNRSALLGLARLAVQEGAIDTAKQWLERAAKSEDTRGVMGIEWAVIHLMNNDLPRARMSLQEITDLQPRHLQAWAMLAMVQIQQEELEDIEKVLLPKMESIAGTVDNYFIQITRAQLNMRKGKNFQRPAREAFIRASMLRPDIPGVKDMILQLDIAMNDREAAELHARQVLRANRRHALANYVIGSLRLQEGSYGESEDFLRRSVEASPSAAALNDLAEVLRRIRRFEDAERQARAAIAKNAELYVAWETLASILIESGGSLDEAEKAVRKSIELYADDLRAQITLGRVLVKKGEVEQARVIARAVRNRQNELARFDQGELAKLVNETSSGR